MGGPNVFEDEFYMRFGRFPLEVGIFPHSRCIEQYESILEEQRRKEAKQMSEMLKLCHPPLEDKPKPKKTSLFEF